MLQVILSPQAEEDITDILQYTITQWGEAQAYTYLGVVKDTISTIRDYPKMGHGRSGLPAVYKIFPAGKHIVVYRVEDTTIYILRVLHEKMDITHKI